MESVLKEYPQARLAVFDHIPSFPGVVVPVGQQHKAFTERAVVTFAHSLPLHTQTGQEAGGAVSQPQRGALAGRRSRRGADPAAA